MQVLECNSQTDRHGREIKQHGTVLFPVAGYHDNLAEESVPWHWHEELEAVVVTEGEATVAAGPEVITIRAGDGFFVNSGILHAAWGVGGPTCRLHSVVYHPRLIGGSVDSVFWQHYLQPLMTNHALGMVHFSQEVPWQQEAIRNIETAWQAWVAGTSGHEFKVRSALSEVTALLMEHCPVALTRTSDRVLRDGERIKTMLNYIQEHYSEPLSIAQIADSVTISESECLRCFRNTIGTTPIQYVNEFRIQKAAELLSSTGQKVVDIGFQCGFQDMSYFSKIFRKFRGCTPVEYRRMRHNAVEAREDLL